MRAVVGVVGLLPLLLASTAQASDCDRADPAWLMCEDFEGGAAGWESWYADSPWTECAGCPDGVNNPERIRLENDAALVHDGDWALHTPGGAGAGYQGGTLRYASCDGEQQAGCSLVGHDRLYFRTWVRLAADHDYVHHFIGLGGTQPDAYWNANGNAGCRPAGDRWAGTRVDLNPDHELFFYTYYPDMNCDSGGYCSGDYAQGICDGCAGIGMPCSNGPECCWGNHFSPDVPVVLPTEEWTCLEMSMELNTPGVADGSMTFWVDDVLGHEATGIRWRDGADLQLNRAMLEHFIDPGDTDHPNQAWFDDVIVSTERIGCAMTPGEGTTSGGGESTGGDDETSGEAGDDTGGDPSGNDSDTGTPGSSTSAGSGSEPETSMSSGGEETDGTSASGGGGGCSTSGGHPAGLGVLLFAVFGWVRRRR